MRLRSHGLSHVGMVRLVNQDAFCADDRLGFYVVADGVGGRAAGEVASRLTVEEALSYLKQEEATLALCRNEPHVDNFTEARRLLENALMHACYMVHGQGDDQPEHHGMSTTVSALLMLDDETALVAQVGDSRLYRYRAGNTKQLTEDHTLINYHLKRGLITPEEAAVSPNRNVITRAVGHRDYVQVDTFICDLQVGDRYLLCTDGLHGYMDEGEIGFILGEGPLPDVTKQLIDVANDRGGKDNITALVVACSNRPTATPMHKKKKPPEWTKQIKRSR